MAIHDGRRCGARSFSAASDGAGPIDRIFYVREYMDAAGSVRCIFGQAPLS
ncbi:hypothetical protein [Roseateles chitinivorans]|uniref:hypothetical protein n=1 Tax=Roseateles chitinivorans TaxID=2917965 RepID=UPI001304402F|nr:hypothetical protein [Roseateles chitinivorans]